MTFLYTPTQEQEAIITCARDETTNILMEAYAGCAKSSTIQMLSTVLPKKPTLAVAFNVKIKKELERLLPLHCTVMTFNGLGHRAWQNALGKRCVVEEGKLGKIVTEICKKNNLKKKDDWDQLRRLTAFAMQEGLVPKTYAHVGRGALLEDTEENWINLSEECFYDAPAPYIISLAGVALTENIRQAFNATISYDDQLYCPIVFNSPFQKYAITIVDEVQDLSLVNKIQLDRCAGGRIILAGDTLQSIYGFRGAHTSIVKELLSLRPDWKKFPLTTTFRCPQVIVKRNSHHAKGFKATADAPQGNVYNFLAKKNTPITFGTAESALWKWEWIHEISGGKQIAIICRNNAPLLALAFKLLRMHVPVAMLGRDIGTNLITLSKKILPANDTPHEECVEKIQKWILSQIQEAQVSGKDYKVESIQDRGECLLAVLGNNSTTSGELRSKLEDLFSKKDSQVVLGTGHRVKGLEFPTVIHLDPWRIPSKHAVSESALQQEENLRYVIETRVRENLVLADLSRFDEGALL